MKIPVTNVGFFGHVELFYFFIGGYWWQVSKISSNGFVCLFSVVSMTTTDCFFFYVGVVQRQTTNARGTHVKIRSSLDLLDARSKLVQRSTNPLAIGTLMLITRVTIILLRPILVPTFKIVV